MKKTNFKNEIERLNKGVKIAWFINFVILWLVLIASGIFITLKSSNITNAQILNQSILISVLTLPLAIILMLIVSSQSTRILLNAPDGNSTEITEGQLYNILEELAIAARLKSIPRLYVLQNSGIANAYAIADTHGNSQVVLTSELLSVLQTREEVEGVVAHELGHIISGDSQAMTKLVALTSTTGIIAGMATRMLFSKDNSDSNKSSNPLAIGLIVFSFIFLLAAPFLSKLSETYMSRERESRADASAVKLTRNPNGLAKALIDLELNVNITSKNKSNLKTFGKTIGPVAFFNPTALKINMNTHPTTQQRLENLKQMGADIKID